MITNNHTIVPAFHFRVVFTGLKNATEADTRFESVQGIQGVLPDWPEKTGNPDNPGTVFQPVILRRAMVPPPQSALLQWVIRCLQQPVYNPLPEMLVEVLDEKHEPAITIRLKEVSVKSWGLGELHAQKSDLLMEEIALNYKGIEIPVR